MRIVINRAELLRKLRVCERIIPKRGGLPGYYAITLICDEQGRVTVAAHNGREDYSSTVLSLATEHSKGAVAIPAVELIAAVHAAPGEDVSIYQGGSKPVQIRSGQATWSIDPLHADGWEPGIGIEMGNDGITEVLWEPLYDALGAVRYAASKLESRPSFMQIHAGEGRLVASDGRKVHQIALGSSVEFDVPERAVDTLREAIYADIDGAVITQDKVRVKTDSDGQIQFVFGTMSYIVTRINYAFPDIDSLALERARAQTGEVVARLADLKAAVRAANVTTEGQIELTFQHELLVVESANDHGRSRMSITIESDVPRGYSLRLSGKDFEELLSGIEPNSSGDVEFSVAGPGSDAGWVYFKSGETEAAIRPVMS